MAPAAEEISFDEFRDQWLESVRAGNPSPTELGHRFAHKLFTEWLDINHDDILYCDGAGDGGIDIAYLDRASEHEGAAVEEVAGGDAWYLVQSKYGRAFQGVGTLLQEGQKVIDTLDGKRPKLSSLAHGLLKKLSLFRRQAEAGADRIILLFATEDDLTEAESRAMNDLHAMGRERLGPLFSVDAVSVRTIFQRLPDAGGATRPDPIRLPLRGTLMPSGEELLVGVVPLDSLYAFLKAYRSVTRDLDQLYEKNVRRFLGSRGRVNKGIRATLYDEPEHFGLYNNGITIVVKDFCALGDGWTELSDPFIVNGCQTTRTIWDVLERRLEAGGHGLDPENAGWRGRLANGVVVAKIAKVGARGEGLLQKITRYTNSQNAVREKDFIGLSADFQEWAKKMAEQYGVFLEVQRGGWDSRSAWQKQHPAEHQFRAAANAFDLLKVYGAGWMQEAGNAYGRNATFLPNGVIFNRIVNQGVAADPAAGAEGDSFAADDLYAAFRLQRCADDLKFGRGAERNSRKQTRFLFYMTVIELLRDILLHADRPPARKELTLALTKLFQREDQAPAKSLADIAVNLVDRYLTEGGDHTVFREAEFRERFNNDLNGYLKWEALGKNDQSSPNYRQLLSVTKDAMGMGMAGSSPRELIVRAVME